MAAAGEMTASLTLRLRDQLSGGIQELREEFQRLNGTLGGMTDVLREVRDALATLKAPKAMIDGLRAAAGQATDVKGAIGAIGDAGLGVGKELTTAFTDPLTAINAEVQKVVAGVREIGTAAVASGRALKEMTVAAGVPGARRGRAKEGGGLAAPGAWGDLFMGGIAAAFGLGAVKNLANYDQPLGHAAITEKLSGPAAIKEMNRIAKSLQTLALATAQSSQELANAYLFLETTPLKNEKGLIDALMPIMAEAATAYNVPVPEMQQAMFALSDVMKVPAADMLRAFGELAYASKAAHFNMIAFAESLPGLGAQMRLYGSQGLGSVTALAAAMEQVVQFTKSPDEAATDMQDLLHYLASPIAGRMFDRTKRSWKMLPGEDKRLITKYHIPAIDIANFLNQAHRKGEDPITALAGFFHHYLAHITPADATDLPVVLGALLHNMEAGAAMAALVLNFGHFKDLKKQLGGVTGKTVATDFSTAMMFPEAQVKLFDEEFAQITRMIGKDLLPMLTLINAGLKKFIDGIHTVDKEFPGLTATVVQVGALYGGLKALTTVFKIGAGLIGKILGIGGEAAVGAVETGAGSAAATMAGYGTAAGIGWALNPLIFGPAAAGGAIAAFKSVNEAAARQAAKVWSENAKATLNVTVQTNDSGLPVQHDANGLPLLLHFSQPRGATIQIPGNSANGLVLGRK